MMALLSLSLALCGCGKKQTSSSAPAPVAKGGASIESLAQQSTDAPPPPPPPTVPRAPAAPDSPPTAPEAPSGPEATSSAIADYNHALSRWIGMHEDAPVDMDALKKVKGLPPLPAAPAGRQIIYVVNPRAPINSHIELK
jgi:hypothetical protein